MAYTWRKLENHRKVPGGHYVRPLCTKRAFQPRWKELIGPAEFNVPFAKALPKAKGISWPFACSV